MKPKYCKEDIPEGILVCEAVNGTLKKTTFELLGKAENFSVPVGLYRFIGGRG